MRKRAKFTLITLAVLIIDLTASTIAAFQLEANHLKLSDWLNTLLYLLFFTLLTALFVGCLSCIHLLKRKRVKFTLVSLSLFVYLTIIYICVWAGLKEYGLYFRQCVAFPALVTLVSFIPIIIGGSRACLHLLYGRKAIKILCTIAAIGATLYGCLYFYLLINMNHEHVVEIKGETTLVEIGKDDYYVYATYCEYKNAFIKGRRIKQDVYFAVDDFCPVESNFSRTPSFIFYFDKDGNVTEIEY
ncbi:MAG: hypothetical protein LBS74_07135 [Oscillospiraceae bacterium]|jgi:hypothetical protein|nr:hypothetical protein [Oscillospiraceae bacterium]